MEQSPSWEANWSAASQEIPCILWNPKVHHRTHKRTPPVSVDVPACCMIPPLKTLPPGDPSGGVMFCLQKKHLAYVFRNKGFLRRGVVSTSPKLDDHPVSAVCNCLFNIFAATLLIGGRSSIRNPRTRHAVVTGTHLSHEKNINIGNISWLLL